MSGFGGTGNVSCDGLIAMQITNGYIRNPVAGGGCWFGYVFGSTIQGTPASKDFSSCGSGCFLTFSGSLAASDAAAAYLGFTINQLPGSAERGSVVPTGSSLSVSYSKNGGTYPVRVAIRSGSTEWCAQITGTAPSVTIPWSSFRTQCWSDSGTAYARSAIDTVEIIIPGTAAGTRVFDLIIASITTI